MSCEVIWAIHFSTVLLWCLEKSYANLGALNRPGLVVSSIGTVSNPFHGAPVLHPSEMQNGVLSDTDMHHSLLVFGNQGCTMQQSRKIICSKPKTNPTYRIFHSKPVQIPHISRKIIFSKPIQIPPIER